MPRLSVLCSILLSAVLLAGCAATPSGHARVEATPPRDADIARVLWRGSQGGWIYRVDAEAAARSLDHPVQLNAVWLRDYLASLVMYREQGDRGTELSVFSDRQLDRLVPALVRGLARAKPGQEVVFAVVGPLPGARIFKQTVVTTGRVFVDSGRLNIIFGRVLDTVFHAGSQAKFIPGSRNTVRLEPGRQVRSNLWAADPKRRDWVTIAVQRGSGPLPGLPKSAAAAADSGGSSASESAPDESGIDAVRQKLERLKQLYEDDLITREEYARERAEVLEAL